RGEDLPTNPIDIANVSPAFLRRNRMLPLGWAGDRLLVGVVDPERSDGLAALSFAAGRAAEPRLMAVSAQKRAFHELYGGSADAAADTAATFEAPRWSDDAMRVRDNTDSGPAVRIVDALLETAIEQNASDIHIEPLADRLRVRFRIDGEIKTVREEAA